MAIRDIVTRGYGNGTYSPGVNKLPTLGYAIGEAVAQNAYGSFRVAALDSYVPGSKAIDSFVGSIESESTLSP